MYLERFGLRELPFALEPSPKFFFGQGAYGKILESLVWALRNGETVVQVIGDPGNAKTLLCVQLLRVLSEEATVLHLPNPPLSGRELLLSLARKLGTGVVCDPEAGKGLLDSVVQDLTESRRAGQNMVLLFDQAHELTGSSLRVVQHLLTRDTGCGPLIHAVFFGRPEMSALWSGSAFQALSRRFVSIYRIPRLDRLSLEAYVVHRLTVAGGTQTDLFGRSALNALWRASEGIPRSVNVLCQKSMLAAAQAGVEVIGRRHVGIALAQLVSPAPGRPYEAWNRLRERLVDRARGLWTRLEDWGQQSGSVLAGCAAGLVVLVVFCLPFPAVDAPRFETRPAPVVAQAELAPVVTHAATPDETNATDLEAPPAPILAQAKLAPLTTPVTASDETDAWDFEAPPAPILAQARLTPVLVPVAAPATTPVATREETNASVPEPSPAPIVAQAKLTPLPAPVATPVPMRDETDASEARAASSPTAPLPPVSATEKLRTGPGRLRGIRVDSQGGHTRLTFEISRLTAHSIERDRGKLEILVSDTHITEVPEAIRLRGTGVRGIMADEVDGSLRLRLRLTDRLWTPTAMLTDEDPPRLVLDLKADENTLAHPSAVARAAGAIPAPVAKRLSPPIDPARAQEAYEKGLSLAEAGEHTEALRMLQAAVALDPQNAGAREVLASVLIRAGRTEEAMEVINEGLALHPRHPAFIKLRARLLLKRGAITEALDLLHDAAPSVAQDADHHALIAALYLRQGEYSLAGATYWKVLQIEPDRAPWWMGLAIALDAKGAGSEALMAFRTAQALGGLAGPSRQYVENRIVALERKGS
jgi:MSHA biogenesis protein MshM